MASATINASIDDTTTTLLVVHVLRTIYDWSIDFNGNNPDIEGHFPNVTKSFPASVILVTLHPSTSDVAEHYSCRVSTAGAWALNPRQNHSCIHIYITEGMYSGWLLFNESRSKISSADIQEKIETALANHYGVLGEGRLA